MATYRNTAQTRTALINAAGELFAERGVDAVTTREIARRAGTVQNAICYHFGGIGGLMEAVWAYVLLQWEPEKFIVFLQEARGRAESVPEKAALVREVIRRLFLIMYRPDLPRWISKLLVRSSLTAGGREFVARTISVNFVPLLIDLFQLVSGRNDPEEAHCWSLRILAAPMVLTAEMTEFSKFRTGTRINRKLYQKLEEVTCREALFAAGLPVDLFAL